MTQARLRFIGWRKNLIFFYPGLDKLVPQRMKVDALQAAVAGVLLQPVLQRPGLHTAVRSRQHKIEGSTRADLAAQRYRVV